MGDKASSSAAAAAAGALEGTISDREAAVLERILPVTRQFHSEVR